MGREERGTYTHVPKVTTRRRGQDKSTERDGKDLAWPSLGHKGRMGREDGGRGVRTAEHTRWVQGVETLTTNAGRGTNNRGGGGKEEEEEGGRSRGRDGPEERRDRRAELGVATYEVGEREQAVRTERREQERERGQGRGWVRGRNGDGEDGRIWRDGDESVSETEIDTKARMEGVMMMGWGQK